MRREQFTTTFADVDWVDTDESPAHPALHIEYEGEPSMLRPRLEAPDGDLLAGDETDMTVRLHGTVEDEDATGVVALTNRFTGEYVFEVETSVEDLLAFTKAARRYGDLTDEPATYRVQVTIDGDPLVTYEKQALLVYGRDGELLRKHSLIPGGVEL